MIFRVADIETVPDFSFFTPPAPAYKLSQNGTAELVDSLPPPHAHRVVAISYVDVLMDVASDGVKSPRYRCNSWSTACHWGTLNTAAQDTEEKKLLSSWGQSMDNTPDVNVVSWNGRTFDLPVIALRSFRHGLPCRWYYASKDVRYRYSTEGHLDLMDFLSDFGACRPMKLHDAARMIGLPGKTDMCGANIDGIVRESIEQSVLWDKLIEMQASVAKYCLQDSIQTAILFLRSRHLLGKISAASYNLSLATFANYPGLDDVIELDWEALKLEVVE